MGGTQSQDDDPHDFGTVKFFTADGADRSGTNTPSPQKMKTRSPQKKGNFGGNEKRGEKKKQKKSSGGDDGNDDEEINGFGSDAGSSYSGFGSDNESEGGAQRRTSAVMNDLFASSDAVPEAVPEEPIKEDTATAAAATADGGGGDGEEDDEAEKKKLKRRESMKKIKAARNARKSNIESELMEALAYIDGLDEDA